MTAAVGLVPLPLLAETARRRRLRAEESLREILSYMEQLICLFRRRPRIRTALTALSESIGGSTGELIRRELARTGAGGAEGNALFFRRMEDACPIRILPRLHRFLLQAEALGGDPGSGLDLLLEQTRRFGEAEKAFAQGERTILRKLTAAVCLSLLIGCAAVRMVPPAVSPVGASSYEVVSAVYLILLSGFEAFLLFAFSPGKRRREKCMSAGETARLRKILREGGPRFGAVLLFEAAGLLLVAAAAKKLGSDAAAVAALFLLLWQLTAPFRRRKQALRRLRAEAAVEFPEWLAHLALRLQTQTVVTALTDIGPDSCPFIRSYLTDLLREIGDDPVGREPYLHFMEELDLPDVQGTMLLLFAVSGVSRAYARDQLEAVVRREEELNRQREEALERDREFFRGFLIAVPLGLTVLKLMADMILVLSAFLNGL